MIAVSNGDLDRRPSHLMVTNQGLNLFAVIFATATRHWCHAAYRFDAAPLTDSTPVKRVCHKA